MFSVQSLQLGLPGYLVTFFVKLMKTVLRAENLFSLPLSIQERLYLIRFAPLAFVPHRQTRSSKVPSPLVV